MVESLPASAGHTGSTPGLGGSHMLRSGWAHEPQLLSLRVWSLCSATGGAAIVRGLRTAMKSGPRLLQLEKALAQKRRPNTANNKSINKLKKKKKRMVTEAVTVVSCLYLLCLPKKSPADSFYTSLRLLESFYLKAFSQLRSMLSLGIEQEGSARELRMKNRSSQTNISRSSLFSGTVLWHVLHCL